MYSNDGKLLICNLILPVSEVFVVKALLALDREVTVPEIAIFTKEKYSDSTLYTLLRKLDAKGGVVVRKEEMVSIAGGRPLKRVFWKLTEEAKHSLLALRL